MVGGRTGAPRLQEDQIFIPVKEEQFIHSSEIEWDSILGSEFQIKSIQSPGIFVLYCVREIELLSSSY